MFPVQEMLRKDKMPSSQERGMQMHELRLIILEVLPMWTLSFYTATDRILRLP